MPSKLTKTTGAGERMRRLPQVEEELRALEGHADAEQVRRASITGPSAPDYCSSEALVGRFRDAQREGNRRLANALVEIILRRATIRVRARLRRRGVGGLEEAIENVIGKFAEMLAVDAHGGCERLDFFEVLFDNAVSALAFDEAKRIIDSESRMVSLTPIDDGEHADDLLMSSEAEAGTDGDTGLTSPELRVFSAQVLDAIAMLPSEEREVMVLSILGVSTESVDASEPSIAGICNVDPRTVRNRLKRAREKLAYLKELTS